MNPIDFRPAVDVGDAPRIDRRGLLALGAKGVLAGAACASTAHGSAAENPVPAPRTAPPDVGRKFNADGTVHPFAGNTFIGRGPQQGPQFATFDALLDVYREVPTFGFAGKLAMLPPSSYHVTLFGGVNDSDRHTPKWAVPFPTDTPVDKIDALYLERLRGMRRAARQPFEFVCDTLPPTGSDGTLHVPLRPADDRTASRLKTLRDQLSTLTGIRRPDHDRYAYHVTIGYLHALLDDTEAADMRRATAAWMQRIDQLGPIVIPSFHFCTFRDMFAFQERWEV